MEPYFEDLPRWGRREDVGCIAWILMFIVVLWIVWCTE